MAVGAIRRELCSNRPLAVSIQAASAVFLLVALRDSREAGSGDLWKRRHPGVSGECVAERARAEAPCLAAVDA